MFEVQVRPEEPRFNRSDNTLALYRNTIYSGRTWGTGGSTGRVDPRRKRAAMTTVLRQMPASAQTLLGSDALAHVVTLDRNGLPQVSVVWCGVRDNDVLFCTEGSSAKVRNIKRNPRVVLSIEDEMRNAAGTQHHLVIHGVAEVLGPVDQELCDQLCAVYAGHRDHPINLGKSPTAVTVAVHVERIGGNGPWSTGD